MLDPKYDLERPSLICHTTLDVMLCAYRELTCKNAGPVTSSTSPDHQGTGPGPPGPEPNITGTRGACACGPSKRLWNAPGRHTRKIARAAALAAILTSRGRLSARATLLRIQAEQLHPRKPRTRALVDLRAAEQRCGMVSGHYVAGVWAGIGHIRGFESALHTV